MLKEIVLIIPAYNPDEKFIIFLEQLSRHGYQNIIVIDDGSREDTKHYFEKAVNQYSCDLVTHSINLGQGRAYKSGFNRYLSDQGGVFSHNRRHSV